MQYLVLSFTETQTWPNFIFSWKWRNKMPFTATRCDC